MKTHLQRTQRLLPSEESALRKNLGETFGVPGSHLPLGSFLEKIRKEKLPLSSEQVEFFNDALLGFQEDRFHVRG
jgi:hypothetical protein